MEIEAVAKIAHENGLPLGCGKRSISKVIKATVFLKDMSSFSAMNEVYKKYFAEPYPARSCVEVARLPKDVLVEIEAVAQR